jgi:triphosphoribosyl-dephospho-CoA synthase
VTRPLTSQEVAQAFRDACLAELDALKPGNVHRFADDPRMSVADFETSARVAAPALSMPMISVGVRIRLSVEATLSIVGHNTNLGIILLCAPLAAAALGPALGDLRERLGKILAGLDIEDARNAYLAIREAKPGGLGEVTRHGVQSEPEVTLLEAMAAAEGRDRIAWNYVHDFADIFELGLPRFGQAMTQWQSPSFATTCVYLGFLAAIPDTLIARKFGSVRAAEVLEEARTLETRLKPSKDPRALEPELEEFDRSLKARGLNPGTSADLTVATLFAASLHALIDGCRAV